MTRKYQFGIWIANKVQNSNLWPSEDYTSIEATMQLNNTLWHHSGSGNFIT